MKKSLVVPFLLMTTFLNAEDKKANGSNTPPAPPAPPTVRKVHTENHVNGGTLVDDYRWLRDKANPEVAQYLEAENAYADGIMKPTALLQQKLYDEMVSHIKETDVNVPYKEGGYFYYSRWEKGQQYPIFARKKGSLEAAEEITIDMNELAKGQPFMSLGSYDVSDFGNFLAYSTDNSGFRQYRLHVRDLHTGKEEIGRAGRIAEGVHLGDEDAQVRNGGRLREARLRVRARNARAQSFAIGP